MHRILPLWSGEAPYTADSPDRFQPSMKEFKVEGSRGAVIVCPGGGYQVKCDYEGDPICEMINEAGISAFTLDYRVAPCHPEAPLADVLRAIRTARSLGYEKVGVLGFSAGGHLACTAATLYTPGDPDADDPIERLSSRPDAFVPCYAVVDLLWESQGGPHGDLMIFSSDDTEQLRRFSPNRNVSSDTPPAFLWHTATDEIVSIRHCTRLVDALIEHGVPFEAHIFPEGRHGLSLGKDTSDVVQWPALCQNWLKRLGFAQSTAALENLNN